MRCAVCNGDEMDNCYTCENCNLSSCDRCGGGCCETCSKNLCGRCCKACERCDCYQCDDCIDQDTDCCRECCDIEIYDIAESITEDPNTILEADPTRRDFLKRTTTTGMAAAKGDMLGALTSAAGIQKPNLQSLIQNYNPSEDPLASISDEELRSTDEREWIFKVPYARLLRIMKNYDGERTGEFSGGYAGIEIGIKIAKLTRYMVNIDLSQMTSPQELDERENFYTPLIKVIEKMKSAASDAGVLNPQIVIDNFGDELLYEMQGMDLKNAGPYGVRLIHAVKRIVKDSKLPIDKKMIEGTVQRTVSRAVRWLEQEHEQYVRELEKGKTRTRKGKTRTPKTSIEKSRTPSKSGETGGLPPLEPRNMTRRQRDFPYRDTTLTNKAESPYPTFENQLRKALETLIEEMESIDVADSDRQMQDQIRKQEDAQRKREQEREKRVQPQLQKLQSTMNNVNNNVQKGMSASRQTNTTFDELEDNMEDIETTLQGLEKDF